MHDEEFAAWFREKVESLQQVLTDLRRPNAVDVARGLTRLVKEEDVPRLLRIIQVSPESDRGVLIYKILANYENLREVQTVFLDQWYSLTARLRTHEASARSISIEIGGQSETEEYKLYRERCYSLMERLAGLRPETLKEHGLYKRWSQFNNQAFELVRNDFGHFFGSPEGIAAGRGRPQFKSVVEEGIRQIEEVRRFPRTKVWPYLCLALGANDSSWARDLLRRYAVNSEDEMTFVQRVANELLTPGLLLERPSEISGATPDKALADVYAEFTNALQECTAPERRRDAEASHPLAGVNRRLFRHFDVLQWEVMTRNLIQEHTQRDIANFHFLTGLLGRSDEPLLVSEDLHQQLSVGEQYPTDGSSRSPSEIVLREANWNLRECGFSQVAQEVVAKRVPDCRRSFAGALNRLGQYHPEASKLLIQSLINRALYAKVEKAAKSLASDNSRQDNGGRQDILRYMSHIHNGELTFYSLVWTLRILRKKNARRFDELTKLTGGESWLAEQRLPLIFDGEKWAAASVREWLFSMGLLYSPDNGATDIASKGAGSVEEDQKKQRWKDVWKGKDIATARWKDFWEWLRTLSSECDDGKIDAEVQRLRAPGTKRRDQTIGQEAGFCPTLPAEAKPTADREADNADLTPCGNTEGCKRCTQCVRSQHLPMKRLRPTQAENEVLGKWGGSWADQLWEFAKRLRLDLKEHDDKERPNPIDDPVHGLSLLLKNEAFTSLVSFEADSAIEGPSEMSRDGGLPGRPDETALNDRLINAVCRVAYLPAEYLLRQYQPYPMCLLIIPVYRFRVPWIDDQSLQVAPLALTFFTVVDNLGRAAFTSESDVTESDRPASRWRYWQLASLLSGAVSGYSTRAAVDDFWRRGQSVIYHNFSKDLNALDRQVFDHCEHLVAAKERILKISSALRTTPNPQALADDLVSATDEIGTPEIDLLLRARFMNSHIRAQAEGVLYEQPEWCVELLRSGTHSHVLQLINLLVWLPPHWWGDLAKMKQTFAAEHNANTYDWARLFVFDGTTGYEQDIKTQLDKVLVKWKLDEQQFRQLFPRLFPRPRLEIGASGLWGAEVGVPRPPRLLPLFVFSMRAAYQNAFLKSFLAAAEYDRANEVPPEAVPAVVTLARLEDGVMPAGIRITFPIVRLKTAVAAAKKTWPYRDGWAREMAVYRKLAYPWTARDELSRAGDECSIDLIPG